MPKTILIHTLGNRDLQFSNDIPSSFSEEFLEKNNEHSNFFVVKKSGNKSFKELCETILYKINLGDTKKFIDHLQFVILEQAIEYILNKNLQIDQLLILGTHQPISHPQDTFPLAKIAKQYFEKSFPKRHNISNVKIRSIDVSPLSAKRIVLNSIKTDLEKESINAYDNIYLSINQGLPVVTEVFKIIGLFQPYQFLKIHASKGVSIEDQTSYEEYLLLSLKQKLISRLNSTKLSDLQ